MSSVKTLQLQAARQDSLPWATYRRIRAFRVNQHVWPSGTHAFAFDDARGEIHTIWLFDNDMSKTCSMQASLALMSQLFLIGSRYLWRGPSLRKNRSPLFTRAKSVGVFLLWYALTKTELLAKKGWDKGATQMVWLGKFRGPLIEAHPDVAS